MAGQDLAAAAPSPNWSASGFPCPKASSKAKQHGHSVQPVGGAQYKAKCKGRDAGMLW